MSITSREELKQHLSTTDCETTIIKLTASWCAPCKKISPYVHMLNNQFKDRSFEYIEIDVDEAIDLYAFFKKTKMANGVPTFLSFKKCSYHPDSYYVPFQCISGANPRALEDFYKASLNC